MTNASQPEWATRWTTDDWTWLKTQIGIQAEALGDALNAAPASSTPIPGMQWTVGELAGHVASIPGLYLRMCEADDPMPLPADLPATNRRLIDEGGTQDPVACAQRLVDGMGELLDLYGDDHQRRVNHWVTDQPVRVVGGLLLNELLMHHHDLARVGGTGPDLTLRRVFACFDGLLPAAVNFVDRDAALKNPGVFHTRLRDKANGHRDWTQQVSDGVLTVAPGKPERADVHFNADPVAFLLLSQGRMSQLKASLTGQILAYGPKPWRALALEKIFVEI